MADVCIICKDKIGLLGKLAATKHMGESICGKCKDQINEFVEIYYKDISAYNIEQLMVIDKKRKDVWNKHKLIIQGIEDKYKKRKNEFMNLKNKEENEISLNDKAIKEVMRDADIEEYRVKCDFKKDELMDAKRMELEYEKALKQGRRQEAENLKELLYGNNGIYTRLNQDIENNRKMAEHYVLVPQMMTRASEVLIKAYESAITCCEKDCESEKFTYSVLHVGNEYEVLGFTGIDNELTKKHREQATNNIMECCMKYQLCEAQNLKKIEDVELCKYFYLYEENIQELYLECIIAEAQVEYSQIMLEVDISIQNDNDNEDTKMAVEKAKVKLELAVEKKNEIEVNYVKAVNDVRKMIS